VLKRTILSSLGSSFDDLSYNLFLALALIC